MRITMLAVLIAVTSVAQDAPLGGVFEGTVINTATGAGIAGASVVLSGNPPARYQATSDIAGHFRITGVAPGNYHTTVEKDGFWPPSVDLSTFLNAGLHVASGGDPVKVEFKLAPFNTLRGRVIGPDGKPAKGVEVRLNPNIMANEVLTDDEGRFALENTRPGSYTLIAKPPDSARPQQASDGTRIEMVTTYYPSAADQALAQQIVLSGQPDLGGYEIRMQSAPVYRVRGIVLNEDDKPSSGAELTLTRIPESTPGPMGMGNRVGVSIFALGMRRPPRGTTEAIAIAREDGHFEFPAVRSGDWRVTVVSDGGSSSRGSASARVGRSDVDDLEIHAATPFNLTGTVEWKGEAALTRPGPLFDVVTLMNPDTNELAASGIVESGHLLFENVLPGLYKAIVKPGLSAQIFMGDYEVTGQTFSIAAGDPHMRLVLKTWSGSIRGTVEKGDGATVVLFPQRVEGVTLGQTIVCGAGGAFELSEVSPGDYYIAAFEHLSSPLPGGPSVTAAMLSLLPSRATSVKVEERLTANVTLSVIAAPR